MIVAGIAAIGAGSGEPAAQAGGEPTCFGKQPTLSHPDSGQVDGTNGRDVITTGGKVQLIRGLGGRDLICSGGNRDVIAGGRGADRIQGERGRDNLRGGPGDDRLEGGRGADLLGGGSGDDECVGGGGSDLASPSRCERIRGASTHG